MSFFGQGVMATTGARLTLPTANLLAAYDARVGVTNVAGACSAWADQSGNGWHASQGTAAARPLISTADGYASLLFDGTNDLLSVPSITSAAGPKTVYAVSKPTTVTGAHTFFHSTTGVLANAILSGSYQANDGTWWRSTGVAGVLTRHRVAYQTQSGDFSFWKNGVAATPKTWVGTVPIGGATAIGANAGGAWFFSGHILFLAVYNATRNLDVEDYITQEWGV